MTKYFEVLRRDGPARLGKLLLERRIDTPALIRSEDYISAGSVFIRASLEEVKAVETELVGQKKLVIAPYVPAALHSEPAIKLPQMNIDGPKGVVAHPFSLDEPENADVYVLASAGSIKSPRDLINAILNVKNRTPPDTAIYAPALATPSNLAFLVYLGIDLLDSIRIIADSYLGRYHTKNGVWNLSDLEELPCRCEHCVKLAENKDSEILMAHNMLKLEEELLTAKQMIRLETIREYIEGQVRVKPELTSALRILDLEHQYLEARTQQYRHSVLFANTAESLKRIEITRFAERVLKRYKAPESDVLLMLPCSSRKPYSKSRSHILFGEAIGFYRRYLHELILTSPLALVPRELEDVYPAASYDVPITGRWDLEERSWLLSCLDTYLERNKYKKIIVHVEGELEETLKDHGVEATYTGGGTNGDALARLHQAVKEACGNSARLGDAKLRRYRAIADYYFGEGAGNALLVGKVAIKGRELQDERRKSLAKLTMNGTLALSLEGAKRLQPLGRYVVTIGDFVPRGSLLAPGVMKADERIRPGDEVIIQGSKVFGIGKARMSGWEMIQSKRGVAVDLRHIKEN